MRCVGSISLTQIHSKEVCKNENDFVDDVTIFDVYSVVLEDSSLQLAVYELEERYVCHGLRHRLC